MRLLAKDNPQTAGILCIVAGMLVILCSDMTIKWLSDRYPLHQVVLARSLVALPIVMIIACWDGGLRGLRTRRPLLHVVRGLLIVVANSCFFLALAAMPVADAMALFFVAPLFITALSVPVLGEKVGPRRWLAVLVGLAGVIVMLRPTGEVFRWAALLPVLAAFAYAIMQMLTRRLGVTDRASSMALNIQLVFVVVSAAVGLSIGDGRFAGTGNVSLEFLLRAWRWPSGIDGIGMIFCGVCIGCGGYLLSQAYRLAQASVVAPFEYVALPWGVLLGFMIWGEVPSANSWLGMALIVGSGLFVFYRRRVRVVAEQ